MAGKRRAGLGRGLDALLSGGVDAVEVSREEAEREGSLREIQLHKIVPGKFQPRRHMMTTRWNHWRSRSARRASSSPSSCARQATSSN